MGTKTLEMVDRLVPLQHMGKTSRSPLSATNKEGGPTNREHHARLSLSLSLSLSLPLSLSVVVVVVVILTLTDPLRIQPWSQDRRNQTKSNRESEISRESRQKRTAKKVASKGHRRDKIKNTNKNTQTVETN